MTRKISFEESLELDPLTPQELEELEQQREWDLYLESIPTPYERNRLATTPTTRLRKPS